MTWIVRLKWLLERFKYEDNKTFFQFEQNSEIDLIQFLWVYVEKIKNITYHNWSIILCSETRAIDRFSIYEASYSDFVFSLLLTQFSKRDYGKVSQS